ncbi:MAG: hypothetical protein QM831_27760 [Kofleriaceae bacterium]
MIRYLVLTACWAPHTSPPDNRVVATNGDVELTTSSWKGTDSPLRTELCAASHDEQQPFHITAAQATKRYGIGITHLYSNGSSERRPIEVCGPANELRWLAQARCDDGSNPYDGKLRRAHQHRQRAISYLEPCTPDIDVYDARCPEATYYVYMDMDFCAPGEDMQELNKATRYPDE